MDEASCLPVLKRTSQCKTVVSAIVKQTDRPNDTRSSWWRGKPTAGSPGTRPDPGTPFRSLGVRWCRALEQAASAAAGFEVLSLFGNVRGSSKSHHRCQGRRWQTPGSISDGSTEGEPRPCAAAHFRAKGSGKWGTGEGVAEASWRRADLDSRSGGAASFAGHGRKHSAGDRL